MTFGSDTGGCRSGGPSDVYPLQLDRSHDDWWTVRMRELKYGGDSIKSSGTRLAIIDSGTSFITISETDFE